MNDLRCIKQNIDAKYAKPTSGLEDSRVTLAVALGKGLHHSVDLLCFTRKSKTPKKLSVWRHISNHIKKTQHKIKLSVIETPVVSRDTLLKTYKLKDGFYSVLPECLNQVQICELMQFHKSMKDLNVEVIPVI